MLFAQPFVRRAKRFNLPRSIECGLIELSSRTRNRRLRYSARMADFLFQRQALLVLEHKPYLPVFIDDVRRALRPRLRIVYEILIPGISFRRGIAM